MRTLSAASVLCVCGMIASATNAGPDAIVGDVVQGAHFGQSDGVAAFAFGYATCNLGDGPLVYEAATNEHPVWAQNLYRLKDGVFEQVGMSHLVHGFFALSQSLCATCTPAGLGDLGPGCSDVNAASLAGAQHQLGPRWQVNAYTGEFPFPYFSAPYENTTGRRLQALVSDVDPAQNQGAAYWAEVQIVAADDAASGGGDNNASSRRVMFDAGLAPALVMGTQREVPAIRAWAELDPEVSLDVVDTTDDGRFFVASRAYNNGDGTWLYVYAVHNLNNDRSARALGFDIGSGVVTNPGFSSPFYHSGDGINGETVPHTPWAFSFVDERVRWETETFAQNPNANALRWGTTYSFWFTSTREPIASEGEITLFKPGTDEAVRVSLLKPRRCLGDLDNGGTVDFSDLNRVLAEYGQSGEHLSGDANNDGVVDFADLNATLTEFGRTDCL